MNLEMQVCSLELAKRLNELGVEQDSYFFWYAFENPLQQVYKESDVDEDRWRICTSKDCSKGGADWIYSAFSIAELIEMLPERIIIENNKPFNSFMLQINKRFIVTNNEPINLQTQGIYSINYYCDSTDHTQEWLFNPLMKNIYDENFSNALAKMLIYLIENEFIGVNHDQK